MDQLSQSLRRKTDSPKRHRKATTIVSPKKLDPPFVVVKSVVCWEDAYPFLQETIKAGKETFEVKKYFYSSDPELESFLYRVIRPETKQKGDSGLNPSLPTFIKNNFKKIRKLIEKEIKYRNKTYEGLSKEQAIAFQAYFKDESYFTYDEENEYFQHELEGVYINFLKAYLDTGLYDSRAKSHNRKRLSILEKYGIKDGRL